VWERARAARRLGAVVVATDDDRIRRVVEGFGGEVMMTSPDTRAEPIAWRRWRARAPRRST
jgi:CMP-2-keto-3-deoxyoctulosonic acid synthetase